MNETLDKAYLEYSKMTKARTERELRLASCMRYLLDYGGAMRQVLPSVAGSGKRWEHQVKIATDLLKDLDV